MLPILLAVSKNLAIRLVTWPYALLHLQAESRQVQLQLRALPLGSRARAVARERVERSQMLWLYTNREYYVNHCER